MNSTTPSIQANNAFFYYADLERATRFYGDIMGFTQVTDYGFARTFQIAATSFLTLVDGNRPGVQHRLDEPKSVTLALVSQQVEGWLDYLRSQQVTIRYDLNWKPDQPHDGFVALDPEGYFLEIERFNPHPENEQILPTLAALPAQAPALTSHRPSHLTVSATILWLYYQDLATITPFYETTLSLPLRVRQSFSDIYQSSPSGFLGPVLASRGLHRYSEERCVTVSLITGELNGWFDYLRQCGNFPFRTEQIHSSERYRAVVGYDPAGYFWEFTHFRDVMENERLIRALKSN
ncbi:MAG: VOC family protein [Caldilineaceae bacterium]